MSRAIHSTSEKLENVALFQRLGLPATLTRHENIAFWKCSLNRRNLKTPTLSFRQKIKEKEKQWHYDHVIPQKIPLWLMIFAFSSFVNVVWTKRPFLLVWTEHI